jgi:archaellum component FlaD/FlaE
MVRRKGRSSDVEFVIDEEEDDLEEIEEEENVEVSTPARKQGVKGGDVERYEVRIGPPMVSGRKVKPVRSPEEKVEGPKQAPAPPRGAPGFDQRGMSAPSISIAGTQQLYKIEDDLRRTRDIVEDMKHNVGMMEGEVKDLKAEMDRMSYLLKSLEGLKNAMKDIESTVSELSGLYDLISANINPFVEIPPLKSRDKIIKPEALEDDEVEEMEEDDSFQDLTNIFDEGSEEPEEVWSGPDLVAEEAVLRWTKFLIDKVGKEGLERTLEYYSDLGWIDEDLIDRILEIARGTVGHKGPSDGRKPTWRMDAEDHVQSLEFIKKIRSKRR